MKRISLIAFALLVTLGPGCVKPAPAPEPGQTVPPTVQTAPPTPPPNIPPPTPVQPKGY